LVTGTRIEVFDNLDAKEAIKQYFLPDTGPPVSNLKIIAKTDDGKEVTLNISDKISVSIV